MNTRQSLRRSAKVDAAPIEAEEATIAPSRPPMREDSLERARRRAAEFRQHVGGLDEGTDEFYIPPDIVPDGWTYEWKRHTLLGQEDPAYQVHLARMGWEAVPVDRHPEMMPAGWQGSFIERKGQILMERPKELVDEVRRMEMRRARDQVRVKEQQIAGTPEGTFTRDDPRVSPKIKKGFEPIPVPGDE